MFDSDLDPIAPSLQAVLSLFELELAEVKFPGLDASVLQKTAAEVKDRAAVVATAREALEVARQGLLESQEALMLRSQRALAYARVFAEDDAALLEKLEMLSLPKPLR